MAYKHHNEKYQCLYEKSFFFPFDSLVTIAKIKSPDNRFRIFNWLLRKDNDTYEELYRSYRTLVYTYFQALNVVSRQIGGVKVDLSHTDQSSSIKPFESVDKETQKKAMDILAKYAFSNKILLQEDLFPYLMKQRRGFNVSSDPGIHQRILVYQNRSTFHSQIMSRIICHLRY